MSARAARFRGLVSGPTWPDLNAVVSEVLASLTQQAMDAKTDSEAHALIDRARAARDFAFAFTTTVENEAETIQGDK